MVCSASKSRYILHSITPPPPQKGLLVPSVTRSPLDRAGKCAGLRAGPWLRWTSNAFAGKRAGEHAEESAVRPEGSPKGTPNYTASKSVEAPAGPRADGALPFPLYVCAFLHFRLMKSVLIVTFADSPRSPIWLINGRTCRLFPCHPSSSPPHANSRLRNFLCHRPPQSARRRTHRRRIFHFVLGSPGSEGLAGVALRVTNCGRNNAG